MIMKDHNHNKELIRLNGEVCEIDEECVDWVLLFNKIGLTTKFCCQGDDEVLNDFEIIFHEDVTDEQVHDFLKSHPKIWGFSKWTRTGHSDNCDTLYHNWTFNPGKKSHAKDLFEALHGYDDMKDIIDNLSEGYEIIE